MMLSKTRSTPVHSPAPGVIPDTITGPVSNGSSVASDPEIAPPQPSAATARETRREVAFLLVLAASNTAHVKVNWVFGSSHVSLVWLVLFAAILGWLVGLIATAAFHWRTRAPRQSAGTS
jgi:Lipopolysaccharide assembly protein A domain